MLRLKHYFFEDFLAMLVSEPELEEDARDLRLDFLPPLLLLEPFLFFEW